MGFTSKAACGVIGNIERECGFNPGAWQTLNNLNGGYGLVQWTPATKFINYAYDKGIISSATASAVNSLAESDSFALMNAELDFLVHNCIEPGNFFAPANENMQHTNYRMTFNEYKAESTLSASTLAIIFHDHYIRSGDTANNIQTLRAGSANKWYNFFN